MNAKNPCGCFRCSTLLLRRIEECCVSNQPLERWLQPLLGTVARRRLLGLEAGRLRNFSFFFSTLICRFKIIIFSVKVKWSYKCGWLSCVALLIEGLCSRQKAPSVYKMSWWCTPVCPVLRKLMIIRRMMDSQDHSLLHNEFGASLGYMKPGSQKNNK